MTNTTFKKAVFSTLAAVTIVTSSLTITTTANAGSRDFIKGLAAGVITGAVVGSIRNRQPRQPRVIYVEPRRVPVYQPRTVSVPRYCSTRRYINLQPGHPCYVY